MYLKFSSFLLIVICYISCNKQITNLESHEDLESQNELENIGSRELLLRKILDKLELKDMAKNELVSIDKGLYSDFLKELNSKEMTAIQIVESLNTLKVKQEIGFRKLLSVEQYDIYYIHMLLHEQDMLSLIPTPKEIGNK